MNWYAFMGIASTFALVLPAVLIIYFKLYTNRSLLALLVYYLLGVIYNLMVQDFIPASREVQRITGAINNYLDTPLMLFFLMFFCAEKWIATAMRNSLWVFVAYELLIIALYGFSLTANIFALGPGILIVLLFTVILFTRHIRISIVQGKGIGKTLMLASVVFTYGCFSIIYLFHYIQRMAAINDVLLLYHITILVASLLMTAGVVLINKHLKTFYELKQTRRELQLFFGSK